MFAASGAAPGADRPAPQEPSLGRGSGRSLGSRTLPEATRGDVFPQRDTVANGAGRYPVGHDAAKGQETRSGDTGMF